MDTTNMVRIATDDPFEYIAGYEEDVLNEYNEIAEINGWETADDATDDKVLDWVRDVCQFDWEDFHIQCEDTDVLIIADLGLWDGRHAGGKTGRLKKLWDSMMEDYNSLYYDRENGVFHVKAIHHDGTNWFTIYKLNKAGKDLVDNEGWDYSPRELHQYLLDHKDRYIDRMEW